LNYASGQYVIFLNSGDQLASKFVIADLAKILLELNPDFLYGDSLEMSDGVYLLKKARSYKKAWYNMFTHHQSMLYRRDLVADLRFNLNFRQAADYDLTLRFLSLSKKIHYLPEPICIFERGGVSGKNIQQSIKDLFTIRVKTMGFNPLLSSLILMPGLLVFLFRKAAPKIYDLIRFRRFSFYKR